MPPPNATHPTPHTSITDPPHPHGDVPPTHRPPCVRAPRHERRRISRRRRCATWRRCPSARCASCGSGCSGCLYRDSMGCLCPSPPLAQCATAGAHRAGRRAAGAAARRLVVARRALGAAPCAQDRAHLGQTATCVLYGRSLGGAALGLILPLRVRRRWTQIPRLHGAPPRVLLSLAPRVGLPSALVRRGLASQTPPRGRGLLARGRPS